MARNPLSFQFNISRKERKTSNNGAVIRANDYCRGFPAI
jgi:hypothetical protein